MTQSEHVIWEHLTDPAMSEGLYALVGSRVWAPVAPSGFKNTQAAVVFSIAGETQHKKSATQLLTVVCKCYGGTERHDDAMAVYRALTDRLHDADGASTASGTILVSELVNGGHGFAEPETGWTVALATFYLQIKGN